MLIELIRYFQQPVYLYLNKSKTDEKNLNEIQKKKKAKVEFFPPLFLFYFFIETKSYVKNKIRKKGRIKRKITRKLILTQNIID